MIAPAETLELAGVEASPPEIGTPGVRTEIWMMILLGVLAVLLVEWVTYHRRLTV